MTFESPSRYGSRTWLEEQFKQSDDDPWGLSWRAVEQHRYSRMIKLIRDSMARSGLEPRNAQILDVGCATGHFTKRLASLSPSVLGIDIAETAVSRAAALHPSLAFQCTAVDASPIRAKSYDVICCSEVLYYVPRDKQAKFIAAIGRALKPGGLALVSSMLGHEPYFQASELQELLSQQLSIRGVEAYGCAAWVVAEGKLRGVLDSALRWTRRLDRTNAHDSGGPEDGAGVVHKLARRWPPVRAVLRAACVPLAAVLQKTLQAEWLAGGADRVARACRLRRTHAFVIVSTYVDGRS